MQIFFPHYLVKEDNDVIYGTEACTVFRFVIVQFFFLSNVGVRLMKVIYGWFQRIQHNDKERWRDGFFSHQHVIPPSLTHH